MNSWIESFLLPMTFLLGACVLTMFSTALAYLGRIHSKELLKTSIFFFRPILLRLFPKQEWDALHGSLSFSKSIYQLLFALSGFFFLVVSRPHFQEWLKTGSERAILLGAASLVLITAILSDFLARLLASIFTRLSFRVCAPLVSLYLLVLSPLTMLSLLLTRRVTYRSQSSLEQIAASTSRAQIQEFIRESELQHHLDSFDQKLISSVVNFKRRMAKEIMIPRVDVFCLPAETPIQEAGRLFAKEEYSRIPLYRDSMDQIVGVALYKDLLKLYLEPTHSKLTADSPLEFIAKPVLYAPENKKIANLLQEFRNKQIHMAIIVDEYGGTEGIVTIEDILEELVGEIEDEYDIGETRPFLPLPTGGWVVNAKMSIFDIEEQLGIRIPPNPEYETIGGYVFHCAGMIPAKGWRLIHDNFELEVLSSTEKSLKKIKILPHRPVQDYTERD